jgi:hypothetical protein
MTKFYSAHQPSREKPLQPSFNADQTLPVATSPYLESFLECEAVAFILRNGQELRAMVNGLEDDGDTIFGSLSETGRCFALPISSVLYCVEV